MLPTVLWTLAAVLAFAQPPRVWDDVAIASMEVPITRAGQAPKPLSAEAYYKLPVRPLWRTYPVYHPAKAPDGYIEWLRSQVPQALENPTGAELFEAPIVIGSLAARLPSDPPFLHEAAWFDRVKPPLTREGAITGFVYVIRTKGKIEIGTYSCALCHSRVMPNGAVLHGGPGNFPVDDAFAEDLVASDGVAALRAANRAFFRRLFYAPWMAGEEASVFAGDFNLLEAARHLTGHPPGVMSPYRSTPWRPVPIPGLFGVQDLRYLGRTGLYRNGGPADLMRYLAIKQLPYAPDSRYSDEQLAALVSYVTNRKAPPSPFKLDKIARQGEKVFEREGCSSCHTPPLYTNNKTIPADGGIGVDRGLAVRTRLGTGFYRVPSLRGLWLRGPLGHTGVVANLEEWLSPTRLSYEEGHEFGLNLPAADRFALITFLRSIN